MISGRDIIFISSIDWDYLWQVHQEIAFRFAAAGNRVLYIENTGVRTPKLPDAKRAAHRLQRWSRALLSNGLREVAPNIFVSAPLVMPPFRPRWLRLLNRHVFLPAIKRLARRLHMRDPLLWTYLPTDTALDLIRLLATPRSVVTYYCGADFSSLTPRAQPCRQSEAAILRLSDLVLTTCEALAEHCKKWHDEVHVVPAIVNLDAFLATENKQGSNGRHRPQVPSANNKYFLSAAVRRPVIGYVGGLHRFVDYDLLAEMARARPHWSWVFVGTITADIGALARLPNIHLLGQRPHRDMAHYIGQFDVCLIPYLNNRATATVVPIKLNEYLAAGKPIVSTNLPTICDFNARHQILITAANEPPAFLHAIEQALAWPNDEAIIGRRREVAALAEAKAYLNFISGLLETKLQEKATRALSADS
jgi:glycosyltransferase involved in cell wall biosynthesis